MLELCFDMSTRGALRVAQRCGGTCCAGGVMVMMRPRTGTGSGIWRQRSD